MGKIQTITDDLREMISSGRFADGRLPGERELAVKFDCCRKTIRAVLAELESEGWLDRCRKKGTTVREKKLSAKGTVGLVMYTKGHFFEDIYHYLLKGFTDGGHQVHSVSINSIVENSFNMSLKKETLLKNSIQKLIASDVELIVVNAYMSSKIPLFKQLCKHNIILVGNSVHTANLDVPTVFFDYEKAGYLGGKYLIEQGCKRPVYFAQYFAIETHLTPELYVLHKEKLVIDGFRKAMIEGGINPDTAVINSITPSPDEHKKILSSLSLLTRSMPDGFMSSDANVALFMNKLLENQGRIPEKMVFAGLYNTPWSSADAPVPFSSVDFNACDIADAVLKMSELPIKDRKNIYVSPKLVTRKRNGK